MSEGEKLSPMVYQDLAQPSVRPVGAVLGRAVQMALAPIRGLLWSAERLEQWIEEEVIGLLERRAVPEEHIITPAPEVAAQVLAGVRTSGEIGELREMFSSLLATAMDARSADLAHPAFAEAIRQLTAGEARVLHALSVAAAPAIPSLRPFVTVDVFVAYEEPDKPAMAHTHIAIAPLLGSNSIDVIWTSVGNLTRLGLTETKDYPESMVPPDARAMIEERREAMFRARASGRQDGMRVVHRAIVLTPFGRRFVEACVRSGGQPTPRE